MPRALSADLCRLIVRLHLVDGLPQAEIAVTLRVCRKTVGRVIKRWRAGQDVPLPGGQRYRWQRGKFAKADGYLHLKDILQRFECIYLDEIAEELLRRTGTVFHTSTIYRAIRRMGWTRKKLETRAREADLERQDVFRRRMQQLYTWDQFLWLDETSKDRRNNWRTHGWAQRGRRTKTRCWWHRGIRYTTIAVMSAVEGVLDWYTIKGAASGADMVEFAKESLVPHLQPFPRPHSVVVMDNCRIHRNEEFVRLIESSGAVIEFLPPYSPELNPIERVFSKVKAWLRRWGSWADLQAGYWAMHRALQAVTWEDCLGYIMKSGSFYTRG